jgi:TP901 family phage tail tape measure protein
MADSLSLSISIGAAAGAALSVFGNLKGSLQTVAAVTSRLKADQSALGREIKAAASAPGPALDQLKARYDQQKLSINKLRASTQALGKSQAQLAANEANRAQLRGKMMETAGLVYLAAQPIKTAIQFEEAMADVKKVVDDTPEGIKKLEDGILELSRRIPVAAEGISQIVAAGAQGGIKKEDLLAYTEIVAQMAVAFDITAEAAGESMAKLRNIFNSDMTGLRNLGDVINHLSNNDAAKANQIIGTLARAAGAIKSAGLSERQGAGLSSTLIALGMTDETASTALRALLGRLSSAPQQGHKFQAAMETIGLSSKKLSKVMQTDAQGGIRLMLEKLNATPQALRMGAAVSLFGREHASSMLLLASSLDVYDKNMGRAGDAAGYAGSMQKEFEARSRTTANALTLLKNNIDILCVTLGAQALPAINDLIKTIQPWIKGLGEWMSAHTEIVRWTLYGLAGLLALKVALLAVCYVASLLAVPFLHIAKIWRIGAAAITLFQTAGGGMAGLAAIFPKISAGFSILGKVIQWAGGLLTPLLTRIDGILVKAAGWIGGILGRATLALGGGLAKAAMMAGQAIMWLGRALLMTPIGLALTGLALAAWLIYQYWEPLKEFFAGVWEGVKTSFTATLSWFSEKAVEFKKIGALIVQGLIDGIDGAVGFLIDKVKSLGEILPDSIREKLGIASPSRVFAEIGGFTMTGLNEGLMGKMSAPLDTLSRFGAQLATAGALTLSPVMAPTATAGTPGAALPNTAGAGPMTIQITVNAAPGMDEKALAELVAQKIRETQLNAAARARSRLSDSD